MEHIALPDKIIEQVGSLKEKYGPNLSAAFDADGTLWDIDVGEIVFQYQIKNLPLDLPTEAKDDPWAYYHSLKKQDPLQGYLWLAQILNQKCIGDVLQINEDAFADWEKTNGPLPIFKSQQQLINLLKDQGVEVYVVTASVRWSVFPGAKRLGIDTSKVIGVQTKLSEDKKITRDQKGFITYRKGKADAIRSRIGDKKLVFASGNTMGDYELLKSSEGVKLAVSAAQEEEELFSTESELKNRAQEMGWLTHSFR